METVAILGAGAMGSALTAPLMRNGHRVHLWGTDLDGGLIAAMRAVRPHPRINCVIDARVHLFESEDLAAALDGVTLIVLAITSTAVTSIYRRALPFLAAETPVLVASKGFARTRSGRVVLIPEALDAEAPGRYPFVAIAGPCKANEVGAERPTMAVFATPDALLGNRCRTAFTTEVYTVVPHADLIGVEVAAATKNAYAIVLGICDGLDRAQGAQESPWHNLKAALFAQAIVEMGALAGALGGRAESVYGLAGVGDLEVTALAGRNRALGERLGHGESSSQAIAAMAAGDQTVEGPHAARLAWALLREMAGPSTVDMASFPLLTALLRILDGDVSPLPLLAQVVNRLPTVPAARGHE